MRKVIFIFLVLLFSFCSKKKENNLPRLIVPKQKNVVEVNSKEMLHIFYANILAQGFEEDINVNYNKGFSEDNHKNNYQCCKHFDTILPKYNLHVIIDTSYTVTNNGFEYKFVKVPPKEYRFKRVGLIGGKLPSKTLKEKSIKLMQQYINTCVNQEKAMVNCFPVLIKNCGNTTAFIKDAYIKIIQEAKDVDGIWKPIEFSYERYGCIVTSRLYKLKPKKYIGLSMIKYYGNFKTKIRTKLQINKHYYYSNEIEGKINRSQFNQDKIYDYVDFDLQRKLDLKDFNEIKSHCLLKNDL